MIWKLVHINDFVRQKNGESVVDLRYLITNYQDFLDIDLEQASHWFENTEVWFYDLDSVQWGIQPKNLKEILSWTTSA